MSNGNRRACSDSIDVSNGYIDFNTVADSKGNKGMTHPLGQFVFHFHAVFCDGDNRVVRTHLENPGKSRYC